MQEIADHKEVYTWRQSMGSQSYAEDRGCQPSGHGTFRGGKSPHVPRKFSAIQCHTTRKTEPHGRKLGLGSLYIKDESYRFGLNALKSLADPLPWHVTSHSRQGKMSASFPTTSSLLKRSKRVRSGHLLYCNRWKPWTRSCLGCQQARTKGSCPDA